MPKLTTSQAAQILHCSEATIRNMDRRGELQSERTGNHGQRLFEMSDVIALRERLDREPAQAES
jgi:excisionase family DNA binding protein